MEDEWVEHEWTLLTVGDSHYVICLLHGERPDFYVSALGRYLSSYPALTLLIPKISWEGMGARRVAAVLIAIVVATLVIFYPSLDLGFPQQGGQWVLSIEEGSSGKDLDGVLRQNEVAFIKLLAPENTLPHGVQFIVSGQEVTPS